MNEFQERLKELIIDNKLNRLQLAKRIDISSTTINGYFNKNYYPTIKIGIKIANFFNCSLDYLFGLSEEYVNHNKNTGKFIDNLTQILKAENISVSRALNDMNMSECNYYRWKNGMFPKTINLIEIAKHFNVSIDYLVGRT